MSVRKKMPVNFGASAGFTLLEVLIALAILAIAATVTLSLITGSMGNIRKVQQRTRAIELAETEMELALIDTTIVGPTSRTGSLTDGTNWVVRVEDYTELDKPQQIGTVVSMPVKLLSYSVEVTGPESRAPDFRLQTLKIIKAQTSTRSLP
jgi:general secretion pathway protein I